MSEHDARINHALRPDLPDMRTDWQVQGFGEANILSDVLRPVLPGIEIGSSGVEGPLPSVCAPPGSGLEHAPPELSGNKPSGGPTPPAPVAIGDLNSTAPGSGARRNSGKVSISLLPLHLLGGCARVLMGGVIKYREWNWARGMKWSVCFDCTMRHLIKWWYLGEDIDKESGEHHLDHVMANLFFLRHYVTNHKDGDDRPPKHAMFAGSLEDFNKPFDENDYRIRSGYLGDDVD
jgi:hypothetical protein